MSLLRYGVHVGNLKRKQNALSLAVMEELCRDLAIPCKMHLFHSIGADMGNGTWTGKSLIIIVNFVNC